MDLFNSFGSLFFCTHGAEHKTKRKKVSVQVCFNAAICKQLHPALDVKPWNHEERFVALLGLHSVVHHLREHTTFQTCNLTRRYQASSK